MSFSSIINGSKHTKCVSLTNQKCEIQPIYILMNKDQNFTTIYIQLEAVGWKESGSCIPFNDLPNEVCVPNKTECLNLSVFNMITGINKSKALTKHHMCVNQKQLPGGVLSKRCSENMHQIYRRTPILKCDLNENAKQL